MQWVEGDSKPFWNVDVEFDDEFTLAWLRGQIPVLKPGIHFFCGGQKVPRSLEDDILIADAATTITTELRIVFVKDEKKRRSQSAPEKHPENKFKLWYEMDGEDAVCHEILNAIVERLALISANVSLLPDPSPQSTVEKASFRLRFFTRNTAYLIWFERGHLKEDSAHKKIQVQVS